MRFVAILYDFYLIICVYGFSVYIWFVWRLQNALKTLLQPGASLFQRLSEKALSQNQPRQNERQLLGLPRISMKNRPPNQLPTLDIPVQSF